MRRWLRPSAEVAMVYGLLGWIYVAAGAAVHPLEMSQPITAVVPVRRDTFGAACFAVSVAAAFALQAGREPLWIRRPARRGPVDAALRTCCVYSALVWIYLCVNSLTHPYTISMRLTHFSSSPSEGTTAVLCFTLSMASLFVLRLRGHASEEGGDG